MRRDTVEVYRDRVGDWRWRYIATNGRILADSGQGYSRRIDAIAGAKRVTRGRLNRRIVITIASDLGQAVTLDEDEVTRGVPAQPWTPQRPTRYGD